MWERRLRWNYTLQGTDTDEFQGIRVRHRRVPPCDNALPSASEQFVHDIERYLNCAAELATGLVEKVHQRRSQVGPSTSEKGNGAAAPTDRDGGSILMV